MPMHRWEDNIEMDLSKTLVFILNPRPNVLVVGLKLKMKMRVFESTLKNNSSKIPGFSVHYINFIIYKTSLSQTTSNIIKAN